jgi:hypothetical protein
MIYYHLNRIHIQISLQDLILQSIYPLLGASIYLSQFIHFAMVTMSIGRLSAAQVSYNPSNIALFSQN